MFSLEGLADLVSMVTAKEVLLNRYAQRFGRRLGVRRRRCLFLAKTLPLTRIEKSLTPALPSPYAYVGPSTR